MKRISLLLLLMLGVILWTIPQQSFAQPENNCQYEADQISCAAPWNIHVETVWASVPGLLNCKAEIHVYFFKRCNVYKLLKTVIEGPSFDNPTGCLIGNYQYLDTYEFHLSAFKEAVGAHLYNTLPPCGQGAETQVIIFAANCLRSVIEYKTIAGNTVTINYNPALGYEHYRQLIISLTGMQSPEFEIITMPCGGSCCKQDVAYCKTTNGEIAIMLGPKTIITGSCDTDPELYCRSSNCE